jgi:CO dehydrogenase/acetyl-CoA synthase gamma subunit (corrinoid Fe-S protein)
MRKSETRKISELLAEYVNEMHIGPRLKEVEVVHAMEEILGTLYRYTGRIFVKQGVLYIQIESPVVKSELIMRREAIRKKVNEQVGQEIVKEIRFR